MNMRDTLEMTWTLQKESSLIYQILHDMEETAAAHTVELGIPRPVMLERHGVVWMIVRAWMRFDARPDPSLPLTVRTWHRGMTGSVIFRDFDLIQNGTRIGEAVQTWVLVNVEARTICRMSKIPELANSPRPETVKQVRPRKLVPPCALTEAPPIRAGEGDVDINGHINNAAYVPLVLNTLPEPVRDVRLLELNYHNECFAGQDLPREIWQQGSEAYVRLMTPDGRTAFDLQATAF